ncbi:IDEAL domain-containing protein [Mesobacillus foraminis]|uniref:IDEAL domain-containing protein n=1 Tax=Mesobacillus foraminis TaxID=279826 RepID=A0A4R2B857_9BACI|nr:IDEAL domain-containing protein [Mesobacillus foraminis]TCN22736.1 IDEAL domain-containing protein [Mesobacillus foraminis]
MIQYFIAKETFTHQIDCFCPGNIHTTALTINKMDIIEVTNEQSFTFYNGWYVQAIINNQGHFYIALEDLERYFAIGRLVTGFDLELRLNYLRFQIDQALEINDEELFFNTTSQLKESSELKKKLEDYLMIADINHV